MSLSERIRPNVEAAPWVIEEIKKLETKFSAMKQRAKAAEKLYADEQDMRISEEKLRRAAEAKSKAVPGSIGIAVGVIDECGELKTAPPRKTWLTERDDTEWRRWWEGNRHYEKVYVFAAPQPETDIDQAQRFK